MMVELTSTAMTVLRERYFIKQETEWVHLTERVANHFGQTEEECSSFKMLMDNMDFLPNSPVLMNGATEIKAYSACYVLPIDDSIESIYKYITDSALISKSGGGVGANFSELRPKDSLVGSTDGVASGPLSFMFVQNESTEQIKQGGRRRGALMGILSCEHEDIWDFVAAKDEPDTLTNFNLSVGITDEFMEEVTNTHMLKSAAEGFSSKNVKLWDELIQRAWSSAEPGVLFMDTIERGNTVTHLGKLEATNPCGEQPLLPYESCTLGSINLSNHVGTFEGGEHIGDTFVDYAHLRVTVRTAVLFLNRILDKSEMPIPECQEAMEKTRKIGLGIMGLHDMLIQLGLPYDSEEGREIAGAVMKFIAYEADEFSVELGYSEGFYLGFGGDDHGHALGPMRRNANLTTIAPTGTLSMIADCSSGCEPYYAPVTYKTVLDGTEFAMPNKWVERALRDFCDLPDVENTYEELAVDVNFWPQWIRDDFKGAEDIHWSDHVKMQGVLQEHVDSSISKTINCPEETTVAEVKEMYELAYKLSCKGVTIYRNNSRGEQVLSTDSKATEDSRGEQTLVTELAKLLEKYDEEV